MPKEKSVQLGWREKSYQRGECTARVRYTNRPERPQEDTKVHCDRIISTGKRTKFDFSGKHLKDFVEFWEKKSLDNKKTIRICITMEREKYEEGEKQLMIQGIRHYHST